MLGTLIAVQTREDEPEVGGRGPNTLPSQGSPLTKALNSWNERQALRLVKTARPNYRLPIRNDSNANKMCLNIKKRKGCWNQALQEISALVCYCSIIHTSQDMDATWCPSVEGWIKKTCHRQTMDYYSALEEGNPVSRDNMDIT